MNIETYDEDFNWVSKKTLSYKLPLFRGFYGGESLTVTPFMAGSGDMAEEGNALVFHTSRLRYMSEDGFNHESQLTLYIDTGSMTVVNGTVVWHVNEEVYSGNKRVFYAIRLDDLLMDKLGAID